MAAAVQTPSVVIFGSSNTAHWRPWVSAGVAAEVVLEEMECQPCHGYFCEKFEEPECIKRVPVERVIAATERVLREKAQGKGNGQRERSPGILAPYPFPFTPSPFCLMSHAPTNPTTRQ